MVFECTTQLFLNKKIIAAFESGGALQPEDPEEKGGAASHPEDEGSVAPHSEGEGSATLLPKDGGSSTAPHSEGEDSATLLPKDECGSTLHLEGKSSVVIHPKDKGRTVLHPDDNALIHADGDVALQPSSRHLNDASSQTDLQMSLINSLQEQLNQLIEEKVSLESKLNTKVLNEAFFKDNDEKVKFYTGLNRYCDLMTVFGLISNNISMTSRSSLTSFQQMIMTLMKLRHNYPMQDLADRFAASEVTCGRIFRKVLDVLYIKTKWMVRWPEREQCRLTTPMCFREKFGDKVAVIIDCFEVFLDRPTNLLARAQTWSSYKHHNTVKFLIGISPQGSVSFISKAWGGRTSDKYIAEHCGILDKILPGDIVLADRGFDIAESVGLMQANLVIPSFLKGRRQLSMEDIASTRKIANVRIHVERVIGVVRQKFHILKGSIPLPYVMSCDDERMTTLDKIAVVCCALTNICQSVVPFE